MEAKCEIKSVSKRFRRQVQRRKFLPSIKSPQVTFLDVLQNVSFAIGKGEFISIVGPSGCGKSTLLRIIAGLEKPTAGEVKIDGKKVEGPAREKGFIFQAIGLYPWRSTIQNVEFFLELNGVDKNERRDIAMQKLALVGLSEFANYPPVQLSGGMQQKVAIARALCTEPSILLMDEPFGALDALSREKAQSDLLQILGGDQERSILFVTHSIDEAVFLSDRVAVFSPRPGQIRQVLNVELGPERWTKDIRSDPKFTLYCSEVRRLLMSEAGA